MNIYLSISVTPTHQPMQSIKRFSRAAGITAAVLMAAPIAGAQARVTGVISDQRLPDSTQMAAMAAVSQRMRSPAVFALANRSELGLSPEQVNYLEALVPKEADSARVRSQRMMDAIQKQQAAMSSTYKEGMSSWAGPIDEAAIRATACESSKLQADMVIGGMRDRHAVGAMLSPEQHQMLDRLQMQAITRALQAPKR
jgi:hypothetical protein